jgi:hypothetical protein
MLAPTPKSALSTVNSCTRSSWPPNVSFWPADQFDASRVNLPVGKLRSFKGTSTLICIKAGHDRIASTEGEFGQRRLLSTLGRFALAIFFLFIATKPDLGHTLPVSFLPLVLDADYLHLELTFSASAQGRARRVKRKLNRTSFGFARRNSAMAWKSINAN